jgi:hypothetical protein
VADPAAFVARLDDPQTKSGPVILPDGSTVAQLPGFRRWLWDGAFCGSARSPLASARVNVSISIAWVSMTQSNHTHPEPASTLHAKNDVHDSLHFAEPLRVPIEGHFDVFVVGSRDLEREACGSEFD